METQAKPVVVRSGEGKTLGWGPAGRIRVIASAEATDSSFSIVECVEPPGSGSPLHVHHSEAEGFLIVEGMIELTCGDDTVRAAAGDFVYAPRVVPHKYVVVGDAPARILLLFSRPGFEQFFLDAGSPPDPRVLEQYGLEVLDTPSH